MADWEVVATRNPPASSLDGATTSTEEPFVVGAAAVTTSEEGTNGEDALDETPTLPPGWEERQDANGRTYYVNHVSKCKNEIIIRYIFSIKRCSFLIKARTTQWQHPGTVGNESGNQVPDEPYAERRRRVHISVDDNAASRRESTAFSSEVDALSNQLSNVRMIGERTDSEESRDQPDSAGSGSGAAAAISPSTGASSEGSSGGGGGGTATTSTSSEAKTEGLPPGWTLQVAPNGRVFFINHTEKKTTWVDPRTGRPSRLPSQNNVPNRKHEDDLGPLPEGWEERVHSDGRIFFIDHNTRTTQVRTFEGFTKFKSLVFSTGNCTCLENLSFAIEEISKNFDLLNSILTCRTVLNTERGKKMFLPFCFEFAAHWRGLDHRPNKKMK